MGVRGRDPRKNFFQYFVEKWQDDNDFKISTTGCLVLGIVIGRLIWGGKKSG